MDLPLGARIAVGIGLAAALAYMSTPVAIQAARRFAFYDKPTGYKGHAAPTPYLGGTAVIIAFLLAVLVGAGHTNKLLPLLGCVVVLLIVGTIDDRRTLSPGLRAGIELLLGILLSVSGLGWQLGAGGAIDAAVTGVWVVAVVNAFNLFDNMDGQASTMALVAAAGVCALSAITGNAWVAAGSAALCGACLGFLPYNLASPARIFLGDGGSMPLGFIVAALVANAARGAEPSTLALLTGVLLVGLPVLDTSLVIFSRRRRGVPILTGGRDHLTHRTRAKMRTARRVALVLGGTQAVLSSLVIIATREGSTALVYVVLGFVIAAASAIVALDNVPIGEMATIEQTSAAEGTGLRPALRDAVEARRWQLMVAVALLGLGAGISPFFSGYYNNGTWVPMGLILVVAAAAVTIARPPQWTRPMLLVLGALAGFGLLALISTGWSESVESAVVTGNRWLVYAGFAIVAYALVRDRTHGAVLLGAVGAGIVIVGASVLVRMFGSGAAGMFIGGRLNSPLGYINGEGCVFAMGAWLGVALAERKQPLIAGAGALMAVVMVELALLSQSRGAAIATSLTIIVALVAIPGARRRTLTLTFIGAGIAVAAPDVIHVYTGTEGGAVVLSSAHIAARQIVLASVGCGVLWGLAVWASERFAPRSPALSNRLATVAAVAVFVVPLGVVAVKAGSIEHTIKNQWHAFVHLSDNNAATAESRLISGGGNRYDYWRIAWNAFTSNPIAGVGAGNYAQAYFQQRRTTEAVQNPHSLELETLAEQGILGGLLLVAFVAGIVLAVVRMRRRAVGDIGVQTLMVAVVGATSVWLVDTSGDWMHLIPGVSAMALAAIVVLCRDPSYEPAVGRAPSRLSQIGTPRLRMLVGISTVVFTLAIAGASLLRSGLAQRYLTEANDALARHPAAAIADANRSLRLDSANLNAYYVKAAGQARFDEGASSQATLLAAAHEDPGSFVTWVLLGDLEVRLGNIAQAHEYYSRAHALDPNDPSVAALVANPASAL